MLLGEGMGKHTEQGELIVVGTSGDFVVESGGCNLRRLWISPSSVSSSTVNYSVLRSRLCKVDGKVFLGLEDKVRQDRRRVWRVS